jgi:dipeptidyl aminopeptidase/acylaminoacyl peptidase
MAIDFYSERFAAGVMFVGISDLISKWGTTDIPQEEFDVHALQYPWDNWQFFLERSPIYYADRSKTPLLILHGEDDPRVNKGQSMELYRYLKARGQAPVGSSSIRAKGTATSSRPRGSITPFG